MALFGNSWTALGRLIVPGESPAPLSLSNASAMLSDGPDTLVAKTFVNASSPRHRPVMRCLGTDLRRGGFVIDEVQSVVAEVEVAR